MGVTRTCWAWLLPGDQILQQHLPLSQVWMQGAEPWCWFCQLVALRLSWLEQRFLQMCP